MGFSLKKIEELMSQKRFARRAITVVTAAAAAVVIVVAFTNSRTAGGDLTDGAFESYTLEGAASAGIDGVNASGNDTAGYADSSSNDAVETTVSIAALNSETQSEAEDTTGTETESEIKTQEESQEESQTQTETETTQTEAATTDPLNGVTAVAQVEKWVNVRVEPTTDSGIVGKIYNNCAATIIDEVDGEDGTWYYMTSGNVTGYIKSEYFVIGDDAEALKSEIGLTFARVMVENLRVRSTPDLSTTDNIVTMYPMGTEVAVLSYDDEWALIETDASSTGYVHISCIEMWTEFDVAITLQEEEEQEAAKAAAEEAARIAAEEYEAALLASQQAQATAEQSSQETQATAVQTEAPKTTAEQTTETQAQTTQTETTAVLTQTAEQTTATAETTDVTTALRNAIVAYALQFEGCPYVHGGRSLSSGTDCSGFTNLVYMNFGYTLDWTPAGQASLGTQIDYHDVQPGDLLFYSNSQKYLGHVALYIGDGKIIHAANEQYGICVWDMNYREPLFAVRIIN